MRLGTRLQVNALHSPHYRRCGIHTHPFGHEGHDLVVEHVLVAVPVEVAGDPLDRHLVVPGFGQLVPL